MPKHANDRLQGTLDLLILNVLAREMASRAVGDDRHGSKGAFLRYYARRTRQLEEEERRWLQLTEAVGRALRFA
jgi:hypothetical protein